MIVIVVVVGGGGTAFRRGDGRQDDERAVVGDVEVQPAGCRNPGDGGPAAVAAAEHEVAGRNAWRAGERKCETR